MRDVIGRDVEIMIRWENLKEFFLGKGRDTREDRSLDLGKPNGGEWLICWETEWCRCVVGDRDERGVNGIFYGLRGEVDIIWERIDIPYGHVR